MGEGKINGKTIYTWKLEKQQQTTNVSKNDNENQKILTCGKYLTLYYRAFSFQCAIRK